MKLGVFIILILSITFSNCKRKRKVNVEGTVTDVYTGLPAQNVTVKLHSLIRMYTSGDETYDYEQKTDNNGYFYFENAKFEKPGNQGWLQIDDKNYGDVEWSSGSHDIKGNEIKFIGKTNLTRNIQVICNSSLQLSLNASSAITHAIFYRKFIGSGYVPQNYLEFSEFGIWPENQSNKLPSKLVGYNDGKNIIKTEYYDQTTQTKKTRYDTIISQGCGSVNNYTITLN